MASENIKSPLILGTIIPIIEFRGVGVQFFLLLKRVRYVNKHHKKDIISLL